MAGDPGDKYIDQTASIVSAYLTKNAVPADEIPALIGRVHAALTRVVVRRGRAGRGQSKARGAGEKIDQSGIHRVP